MPWVIRGGGGGAKGGMEDWHGTFEDMQGELRVSERGWDGQSGEREESIFGWARAHVSAIILYFGYDFLLAVRVRSGCAAEQR